MGEEITNNRLIAKNATMLYIRMFFTMAISFYTSRIVLQALGVSDYGIYNVVGGVTAFVSFFTASLNGATSRFLTYALGKNDVENLKLTFSTAAWVHICMAGFFVLLAETIGLWFVNTQLIIPEDRMVAANWVYQASVVSVLTSITQTPYSASITSHERMSAFAYIAIISALLKLGIAVVVLIYDEDHLILYSILLLLLSICFRIYYRYYCVKHFEECHITTGFDRALFKEMLLFSGWNFLGTTMLTFKHQGLNILMNRFFGTLLNAASGIALQVQGLLYAFTSNISSAFNPQIIKSYAASNYGRVNELIGLGTKFTALVTCLTTIPFIFNMDYLLGLWLGEFPQSATFICQALLFANIFNSFNSFIGTAIIATGKIKYKNIIMSCIYLLFLFGAYFLMKFAHSYIGAYICDVLTIPIATLVCMVLLKKVMPAFSARMFLKKTYFPMILVFVASMTIAALISSNISSPWLSLIVIFLVCDSFVLISTYFFVLDQYARDLIKKYVKSFFKKQG